MDAEDLTCSICLGMWWFWLNIFESAELGSWPRTLGSLIFTSEVFTPPIRITDCGHDFCENCLVAVRKNQPEWQCPQTRKSHTKAITELTRNYRLERFVDAYRKQQADSFDRKEKADSFDDGLCEVHQRPIELCKFKIIPHQSYLVYATYNYLW